MLCDYNLIGWGCQGLSVIQLIQKGKNAGFFAWTRGVVLWVLRSFEMFSLAKKFFKKFDKKLFFGKIFLLSSAFDDKILVVFSWCG